MRRQHIRLATGPEGLRAVVWLALALWSIGLATLGPAGWVILATHGGALAWLRHWHRTRLTWHEQAIVRRWETACTDCRIVNVPHIRRKSNGRLDVRQSAASLTLEVEIDRTGTEDLPDDEARRVILKQGAQLAAMRHQLKMALKGDVAQVRIQERRGNHATVIITSHIDGLHQSTVRISPTEAITTLSAAPNKAWVMNETLGRFVLAQHRYAREYERQANDLMDDELDLLDDEAAAWWVNDVDDGPAAPTDADNIDTASPAVEPRSFAASDPAFSQVDPESEGCFGAGERGGAATPPPVEFEPPEGPPVTWLRPPLPVPVAHIMDVKTS